MKTKTFDCVEMKRHGAARIREITKNMTPEQALAYWRARGEEARREQEELRKPQQANRPA